MYSLTFNLLILDAPSRKPYLQPSKIESFEDDKVELTCKRPAEVGNPPCNVYTWSKLEGNAGTFTRRRTLEFMMEEYRAGNYTCMCGNKYGVSEMSNVTEIIFLHTVISSDSRK